jgi:hypothetical protein
MTPNVDTTDPILYCQELLADWLKARQPLAGIPVLTSDQGNVLEALAESVAKVGLCIIIEPGTSTFGYAGGTVSMDCPMRIIVWEQVTLNRGAMGTRKRASAIVAEIVKALQPQTPAAPCAVAEAELTRDTGDECVYTLIARKKVAL